MNPGYTKIFQYEPFEFGFFNHSNKIEVIAIQHDTNQCRTLGYCLKTEEAESLLETCIKYGFNKIGMRFEGIPGFKVESIEGNNIV